MAAGVRVTEKAFAQQVVELASVYGWLVFRDLATNAHRRCPKCGQTIHGPRNPPGYPDLTLVRERVIFAELKVGKGRLSPHQVAWRNRLLEAGAEWRIWYPEDLQEIVDTLAA